MQTAYLQDYGATMRVAHGNYAILTAAGAGDNTEVDGAWADRGPISGVGQAADSVVILISARATLTDTKLLTIAGNLQTASDSSGTGAADYGTALSVTTIFTSDGGGAESTTVAYKYALNPTTAKKWIRFQFTPDLTATGTDTAEVHVSYLFPATDRPASTVSDAS